MIILTGHVKIELIYIIEVRIEAIKFKFLHESQHSEVSDTYISHNTVKSYMSNGTVKSQTLNISHNTVKSQTLLKTKP